MKKVFVFFKNKAKEFALGPGIIKEEIIFHFLFILLILGFGGCALFFLSWFLFLWITKETLGFIMFVLIISLFVGGFFLFNKYGQHLLDKEKNDVKTN